MRPTIYITIHDWMIHKLNMKGAKLLTFAYIYAWGKVSPKAYVDYFEMITFTGLTRRTLTGVMSELKKDGFIEEKKEPGNINPKSIFKCQMEETHKQAFTTNSRS